MAHVVAGEGRRMVPVKRPCLSCGALVPRRQRAPYAGHRRWCELARALRNRDAGMVAA